MQITEDLELNEDFTWEWSTFNYDRKTRRVRIGVIFREGKFPHERGFEFELSQNKESVSFGDIQSFLSQQDWYDKSKEVK